MHRITPQRFSDSSSALCDMDAFMQLKGHGTIVNITVPVITVVISIIPLTVIVNDFRIDWRSFGNVGDWPLCITGHGVQLEEATLLLSNRGYGIACSLFGVGPTAAAGATIVNG